MSGRALVTGARGFVGRWLCRELLRQGWQVVGGAPEPEPSGGGLPDPVLAAEEWRQVRWITLDVRRVEDVRAALDAAAPDAVFHLAGISFVPAAAADPGAAADVNVVGAARLLGEVRARRLAGTLDPTVLVVGSGEQYGRHDASALPLGEGAEQRPRTVYAATKAAQEVVALEAWRSDGVRLVASRSFNHSGPGQAPHFLLPALVRRSVEARAGGARRLAIGNTATVRDFLHVADVARAYILLVERGAPGEVYNVCGGRGWSVGELAARVLARTGADAEFVPDPALVRPAEVPALVGDPSKLRAATGWRPERTLDDILDDLIAVHAASQ